MEDDASDYGVNVAARRISDLSLSNFASAAKKDVVMPSYDEEAAPLVSRDGRPRGLGNLVESKLESDLPLEGTTAHHTSNREFHEMFKEKNTFKFETKDTSSEKTSESSYSWNFATMMHLLKGNIGTGILAMPNAVSNAGLLVGSIGIPILGVFCVHCMHLLVISSKTLARKLGCTSLDYSSTAEQAFRLGPARIQKFAPFARHAVNTMLMLTQFGFCCVYFLFVSKSFHQVVVNHFGSSPISQQIFMTILLPLMIVFNFIRSLKKLSPASSIANVLQSVGLVAVMYYLLTGPHSSSLNVYTAPLDKLPLYFGTAMYAFEGIGVVLPLENAMATPEDFGGLNGVLNTGMVIIACFYTAVGFYGYLRYGTDVKSSITFNLPQGGYNFRDVHWKALSNVSRCANPEEESDIHCTRYVTISWMSYTKALKALIMFIYILVGSELVCLMFAVAIFLSYALQLYVPISIIWPFMKRKFNLDQYSEKKQLFIEYCLRASLVFITFLLASAIPMLHLFISLVGALASSSLALIFPPIIELATIWNSNITQRKLTVIILKNTFLVTFGVVGCVIGTYTAGKEITFCLTHKNDSSCQV